MASIAELLAQLNDSLHYEAVDLTPDKKDNPVPKNTAAKTAANTAKEGTHAHAILSAASYISNVIEKDSNWRYKVNSPHSSFKYAREHDRHANCATFTCYALQHCGVLKIGQHFYSSKSGNVHTTASVMTQIKKRCRIIPVGKAAKQAGLKPGDVCCWAGHTNIYIGKDSHGHMLWYDAGYSGTVARTPGSRFTNIGPRERNTLESRKLYHIVRVKE